jgi:hypothetical protein
LEEPTDTQLPFPSFNPSDVVEDFSPMNRKLQLEQELLSADDKMSKLLQSKEDGMRSMKHESNSSFDDEADSKFSVQRNIALHSTDHIISEALHSFR